MKKAKGAALLTAFAILVFVRSASAACQGPVGGLEGNCAPDFKLKSTTGSLVSLSDFRGKIVFLNFWATWCEPCVVEVPAIQALTQTMKGKPFVVLTVSIDSGGKKVIEPFFLKALKNHSPSFQVLLDTDQQVSRRYGTFKVPETYVIDRTGKVVDKVEGIRDWSESLLVHYFSLLSDKG